MTRRAFDESEHMRTRPVSAPIGGLFEICHPAPSVPSPASESAADALTLTRRGKDRRALQLLHVLECIGSKEAGKTIDEIDLETGLGSGSVCARISDLRTMGYIDTSATIARKTRRGKNAAVNFITVKGRARLAEQQAAA
jgi:hypothetical protein